MLIGHTELAELIGLNKSRITQLVIDEGMPKEARGKYDAAKCIQWYIAFKLEGGKKSKGSSDVNDARKKLYDEQIERTKLENRQLRNELVSADDYMIDMHQLATIFNSSLTAIPGRLADDPVLAEKLTVEMAHAREDVANAIEAYGRSLETAK